ncbi:hypothetical protein D3C81_2212860 [compost metagenome]
MRLIANQNGAKSFEVQNKEDLKRVYNSINHLEKSELEYNTLSVNEHIYFYFLMIALLCAVALLAHIRSKGVL